MTDSPTHDSRGRPLTSVPRDGPLRPPVKRFYTTASIGERADDGTFQLLLDGRRARTPGRAPLAVHTSALGKALAAEWQGQGATLDPSTMPLTRLANTAIDGVTPNAAAVRADLVAYAGSDLVCYRAAHPAELRANQAAHWDPVIAWAATRFGVVPTVVDGIMPVPQPAELATAVAKFVAPLDPFQLAALHTMTTLGGSVLLALGVLDRAWAMEAAWTAANVDEDWQISQWGEDEEAAARRRLRTADRRAAARLLDLLATP